MATEEGHKDSCSYYYVIITFIIIIVIIIIIIVIIINLTCEVTRMDHMVKRVLEQQKIVMAFSTLLTEGVFFLPRSVQWDFSRNQSERLGGRVEPKTSPS